MYSGRHVDTWFDHAEEQFTADSIWKGLLAWLVLLTLIAALIIF